MSDRPINNSSEAASLGLNVIVHGVLNPRVKTKLLISTNSTCIITLIIPQFNINYHIYRAKVA